MVKPSAIPNSASEKSSFKQIWKNNRNNVILQVVSIKKSGRILCKIYVGAIKIKQNEVTLNRLVCWD